MKSGIYKIICLFNKQIYVGSAVDLNHREKEHFRMLRSNTHCNKHLQNSFNKYGISNFVFEIIEYCDKEKLIEMEQYYIDSLKPEFNICRTAGSTFGRTCSKQTKERISKSKAGKQSGESHPMYGKHHSQETKNKISNAHKGEKSFWYGRKHTQEELDKMSEARVNYHHSEETKEKLRKAQRLNSKFTKEEVCEIRKLREEGKTLKFIAEKMKKDVGLIKNIVYYKSWKEI